MRNLIMKRNRYSRRNNYYVVGLVIILGVVFLSVGFSAFQNTLAIEDIHSTVRVDKDMRVMGARVDSVNDATSLYEDYNVSNITSKAVLSSEDAYVIYEVDVYNLGNTYMGISSVSIDQSNLQVEVMNYNLKDKLCDDNGCSLGVKKKIKLKVSYKNGQYDSNNTTWEFKIDFKFGQIFTVSYKNIIGSDSFPKEVIEGDTLEVSFTKESGDSLRVVMNNKTLYFKKGYTYDNNILSIPNITGNISISLNENTVMKKQIIANYALNEEDIPSYDLDNMTSDEKKNLFSNIATESGIYETKGINGGNVLVFRGNIINNYVQFGGNLWRILQIDEDGNLRLILDASIVARSIYNNSSTISDVSSASSVLGFDNSQAKVSLDSWFKYLDSFSSKIVKSKFCNNFDYVSKTSTGSSNVTNYFKSYQNVGPDIANYSPSLECPDKYIIEDDIGLISAEEYVLAGGAFDKNNKSFFLYNQSIYSNASKDYFWTLSPAFHDTSRSNGDVMIVDESGALKDWSSSLLRSNYILRPVITIDGDSVMNGDGTKDNPYTYPGLKTTASKIDVDDISSLDGNKYFIGNIGGIKNVDGLMSSIVSNTLGNVEGLLGKNTATFSSDKNTVVNTMATPFTFIKVDDSSDSGYYYLKTDGDEYLKINDDKSVSLSKEASYVKIKLGTLTTRSGQILISNKDETVYLNFYGAASGEGDDKFAGWDEVDDNAYMVLYKLN